MSFLREIVKDVICVCTHPTQVISVVVNGSRTTTKTKTVSERYPAVQLSCGHYTRLMQHKRPRRVVCRECKYPMLDHWYEGELTREYIDA